MLFRQSAESFKALQQDLQQARHAQEVLQGSYDRLAQDRGILARALFLLGFDVDSVISLLKPDDAKMWRESPFLLANVEFDAERAKTAGLSEKGVRCVREAFDALADHDVLQAKERS